MENINEIENEEFDIVEDIIIKEEPFAIEEEIDITVKPKENKELVHVEEITLKEETYTVEDEKQQIVVEEIDINELLEFRKEVEIKEEVFDYMKTEEGQNSPGLFSILTKISNDSTSRYDSAKEIRCTDYKEIESKNNISFQKISDLYEALTYFTKEEGRINQNLAKKNLIKRKLGLSSDINGCSSNNDVFIRHEHSNLPPVAGSSKSVMMKDFENSFNMTGNIQPNILACSDKLFNELLFKPPLMQKSYDSQSKIFSCAVCKQPFTTNQSLKRHMAFHVDINRFSCKVCKKTVKTKDNLIKHMMSHSEELFVANMYEKACKTERDLKTSKGLQSERKKFVCGICSKSVATIGHLKIHMTSQHSNDKSFICNICKMSLKTKHGLKNHMKSHSYDEPLDCEICKLPFKGKNNLKNHIKSQHPYDKSFACIICQMQLKTKCNWQKHMKLHTDEKPYICEICKKCFKGRQNLKHHLIIHSNERPFVCMVCKKQFKSNKELKQHMVSHSKQTPYVCEICKKTCKFKCNLRAHILTHSEDKPFTCEICSKCFKTKAELSQHMVSHSNNRPYVCDICGKSCKSKGNLKAHKVSHTG